MKRALLLALLLASCGPAPSGPELPIALTVENVVPSSVATLQVVLAAPSSRFDPLSHPQQCVKGWIPADEALQLTGSDGKQHPSQVIALSGTGKQTVQITGIPPAKQVLLYVEALTADKKLVAQGFKAPISELTSGENAAISLTLTGFAPVDCGMDPLY